MRPEDQYPDLAEQARNLVETIGKITKNPQLSSTDLYTQRMEVCRTCGHYDKKFVRCRACGCHLKAKARFQKGSCPLDKWPV